MTSRSYGAALPSTGRVSDLMQQHDLTPLPALAHGDSAVGWCAWLIPDSLDDPIDLLARCANSTGWLDPNQLDISPLTPSSPDNTARKQPIMTTITLRPLPARRRIGFLDAIASYWLHATRLRGRASRSEYWWAVLHLVALSLIFEILGAIGPLSNLFTVVVWTVFSFVTIVPSVALLVRRLHDTNRSGWWALLQLVPLVGGIILLIQTILPGAEGPNRFDDAAPAVRRRSAVRWVGLGIGALIAAELILVIGTAFSMLDVFLQSSLSDLAPASGHEIHSSPLAPFTFDVVNTFEFPSSATVAIDPDVAHFMVNINPVAWHVTAVVIAGLLLLWQRMVDRHEDRHAIA